MEQENALHQRLFEGFSNVQESDFLPSEVQRPISLLMAPTTFASLDEIINLTEVSDINTAVNQTYHKFIRDYQRILDELDKLPNVFSFDIDFI